MTHPPLIERLAAIPKLVDIPHAELEWLATRGRVIRMEDGEITRWTEDDPRGTMIILSGRLSTRSERGGVVSVVRDRELGAITGVLPYSRIKAPSVYTVAVGPVELFIVDEPDLLEMIRECHHFTSLCVHEMVDRTRLFKSYDLHQEKMASLGRLSAGLAHELGNPSSAIARSARRLDQAQLELADAARDFGAAGASAEAHAALHALESAAAERSTSPLTALELSEREDAIADWLAAHEVDDRHAHALAAAHLAVADLETAASALSNAEIAPTLRLVAARAEARQLANEISVAAGRVTSLVEAVKKHTHMDRAPIVEPIPLGAHLEGTLTLVETKAKARSIALDLTVEPDLPHVDGVIGDLNHVWMHLIDNAIDAVGESGRVSVAARRDGASVVVDVVDDGPGISPEDRGRIFDPFFTTKGVGEGAGLGLDVVRTILVSHKGSVDVSSEPGKTRFSVRLPVGGRA